MYKISKNNLNHLNLILDNLREEDLEEVIAVYGNRWREKVFISTINTDFITLLKDEMPIAIGGFVPNSEDSKIACVWLLCTKAVTFNKYSLLKELKTQLSKAENEFDIMYNFIYKSNFGAIPWIKKLGFKFDNPYPKGLFRGTDFIFFYKVNTERISECV